MLFNESIKNDGIKCAQGIAEWLCLVQYPHFQDNALAGSYPWGVLRDGGEFPAGNWNLAFSIMGLLSAYEVFDDKKYETAALRMGNYLKTLQIFDPFHKEDYGAIRELSPQTPWAYTRDALSGAWGFLELYRYTKDEEYLERALLWAEWFMRRGLDEDGWPYWGVQFDEYFFGQEPIMRNDIQGNFQGGSLNFFYQLCKETGDQKWIGDFFVNMADFFIKYIQQSSGFFSSIIRETKKPVDKDPQADLHRANDDLGTLGLLCAYQLTGKQEYLDAITKFIDAVFGGQKEDGHFEKSAACIPVVMNVLHELDGVMDIPSATLEKREKALKALYSRQSDGSMNYRTKGGIVEVPEDGYPMNGQGVWTRSSSYALIVLLKMFAGQNKYLVK